MVDLLADEAAGISRRVLDAGRDPLVTLRGEPDGPVVDEGLPPGPLLLQRRHPQPKLPLQHRHRRLLIGVEGTERVGEGLGVGAVDGVLPLGAVEGDDRDGISLHP